MRYLHRHFSSDNNRGPASHRWASAMLTRSEDRFPASTNRIGMRAVVVVPFMTPAEAYPWASVLSRRLKAEEPDQTIVSIPPLGLGHLRPFFSSLFCFFSFLSSFFIFTLALLFLILHFHSFSTDGISYSRTKSALPAAVPA